MGQKNSNSLNQNIENIKTEKFERVTKNSFEYISIIGKGGFGKVWKVYQKKNRTYYAMKEMSKAKIIDSHSELSVKAERDLLSKIFHPFIINMQYAFQDRDNLYLILDLLTGGDLRFHLCLRQTFTEEQSKFIICCILLALEYVHSNNIIHRDVKPENLVFDKKGYLKLTDFGIAKQYKKNVDNSNENSGTPGYMAPEVLSNLTHNFCVDYYALGIITYELMFNKRPYNGRNRREIKEQIMSHQIQIHHKNIPKDWSQESADFINKLIIRKPNRRLGYNGISDIKEHPWIKYFNWKDLYLQKINAPYLTDFYEKTDNTFFYPTDKKGLKTAERYMKIKKSQKYLYEFKLYEYYDRRKDKNIKTLIEEENILSKKEKNNTNNNEIINKNSIFNNNKNIKSRNIGNDLKKKSYLSMDDLNKMILKNTKNNNPKKYINPHMIYKVLEEKERNGFSDEEIDSVKQSDSKRNKKSEKLKLGQTFNNVFNNPNKTRKYDLNKYDFSHKDRPKMAVDFLKNLNEKGKFSEEQSTDDKPQDK